MISTDTATMLIGGPAFGPDGEKLGTVGQIYLDVDTGLPEWATIRTGLFGTRENFAPLADGELTADGLQLPYDKERITGAPQVEAEQDLAPEEEAALYEYYGLTARGTTTEADGALAGGGIRRFFVTEHEVLTVPADEVPAFPADEVLTVPSEEDGHTPHPGPRHAR